MKTCIALMIAAITVVGCSTETTDEEVVAQTNDELVTNENVRRALDYGRSVIGTDYGWWYSGPLPAAAPMWTAAAPAPSASFVRSQSTNCAGLTNLMLRSVGKPIPSDPWAGRGGTGAYGRYYAKVAERFDPNRNYPAGTLIGRYFRDTYDQGHVAVVLENGRVLQSFANCRGCAAPGVNEAYTVAQSHAGYFYEYAVLPQDWLGGTSSDEPVGKCRFGDGLYCGSSNGIPGRASTLYRCSRGAIEPVKACANGCIVEAPGVPDHCE